MAAAAPPRFARPARPLAVLWLCAAAALFAGMWARDAWDDYAGWVPALVVVQVAWCAVLGRPARELARWRMRVLKGWVGAISVLSWFGAAAAVMERVAWWMIFLIVLVVAPAVSFFLVHKQWTRRAVDGPDTSAAAMNIGLLTTATASAVIGGGVAALCLWTTPASAGWFAGLIAALVFAFDVLVLAWCVGPWLWTLAVRVPADPGVPTARVVRGWARRTRWPAR